MSNLNNIKLVISTALVALFVTACGISPVSFSPNISTHGVATDSLKGRTVYVKVNDSRPTKNLGMVTIDEKTTDIKARKSVDKVVKKAIIHTLKEYGMTVVDSIAAADNHMFVTIKDLKYVYPRANSAESAMALRISLAGEKATHQNIVSAWSRYESGDPNSIDVKSGLNNVSSRALQSALTDKKMLSVLAGNQ